MKPEDYGVFIGAKWMSHVRRQRRDPNKITVTDLKYLTLHSCWEVSYIYTYCGDEVRNTDIHVGYNSRRVLSSFVQLFSPDPGMEEYIL